MASERAQIDALVAQHAKAHGIPETLIHRIIKRESGYNPLASNRGNFGLMQIRYATARGMGYRGAVSGLLDANTNLTYAVPYLANAYRVSGGNPDRAVALYAGGYYYEAKRKGLLHTLRTGGSDPVTTGSIAPSTGFASVNGR
jgi:soluble lytic murein transglycosylase-like protein